MINFKKNYILNFLLFWEMIFYFFIYINQSPIVPFCVYHWSQILRKSLFFLIPKKNWVQSCDLWPNGYRQASPAVVRRRIDRNSCRCDDRKRFRQSQEAETTGVSNCLRIMQQPECSSGFNFVLSILSCSLFIFAHVAVLFIEDDFLSLF